MKFLDLPPLARINSFLDHVDVGDCVVEGDLEAYSCKLTGLDKKLGESLDKDVQTGSSPLELSASPVGPLSSSSCRKTLVYLILTLNEVYPDYDFRDLRARHFKKEDDLQKAEEAIDTHLLEVSKIWTKTPGVGDQPFLESVWSSIDEAVSLKECEVYVYKSDQDADHFGENACIWSFNYFFYNRKLKRILYFSCRAKSKTSAEEETETSSKYVYNSGSDDDEVNYGMANDMDA